MKKYIGALTVLLVVGILTGTVSAEEAVKEFDLEIHCRSCRAKSFPISFS